MNIDGHAAIVTGAASGMGAATARLLAARGVRVALLDLNAEAAGELAEQLGGIAIACDVADATSAEAAVARAQQAHGAARILINCAGIAPPGRIVNREGEPMPLASYEKVIGINLIGSFNLLRLVAAGLHTARPLDAAGERGVVVNTASVAAYEGQVGQAAYASSKAGLVGLTIQSARELAAMGIRVMTIAPGLIGTPLLTGMPQEIQDSLAAQVPFPKRFGAPDEFAQLVVHICENQMLNGEVIRLDGAIRMGPR